ncbi:hypothetical protein ASD78_12320 [Lysobacter sp. Root667]|uniref:gp53-like domain-containing protein n=1 Tax=Lysobacter sp. Root667 TaxID=1736581 RepID=UPI0006F2A1D8|nr:hypothetical protein [Lysobacter sp. Root667]KRA74271.1 hypothetical protein ASD78_12320 [Lysobacter sp. Root667]
MAYRVTDPLVANLDQLGRVAAGGRLEFYLAGTTDPKSVYADKDLTIDNGSTVQLDSAGRQTADSWGSGSYRVRLYDVNGALVKEVDDVDDPAASTGAAIPALIASAFLTNDGANLIWQLINQVPDPTGSNGKVLGTDGSVFIWQDLPASGVTPGTGRIQLGNVLLQYGTDSMPASGTYVTNKAFNFPTAFGGAPYHVAMSYNGGSGVAAAGGIPAFSVTNRTTTGATACADFNEWGNITNPIPFTWFAIGPAP